MPTEEVQYLLPSVRTAWMCGSCTHGADSLLLSSSRWAWVLQDALGIAFCLYMLKTVRLPTFKVLLLDPVWEVFFLKYILAVNSVSVRRRAPCC